jgi:superoxide dismutase, Cu-Zn family
MKKSRGAVTGGLAAVALLVGCGGASQTPDSGTSCPIKADGPWAVYPNPYGDGGANPAANVTGSVTSCPTDGGSTVKLAVANLTASRPFGAHVHVALCDGGAGGHYRNDPDGGPIASNEVWLDFTSDSSGNGTATADVAWPFRPGGAKAVVIHDRTTEATTGVAGPKLVCIEVPFP